MSLTWHSPRLTNWCHDYDATTLMFRPPIGIAQSGSSAYVNAVSRVFAGVFPKRDYVEVQSAGATSLTVFIDTAYHKVFRVWHNAPTGFGGRMGLNGYDAYGVVVDAVGSPTLVQSATLSSTSSNYGGCWQTTADRNTARTFKVDSTIQSVRLQFRGGTTALRLVSFSIAALDWHIDAPLNVFGDRQWGSGDGKILATVRPASYGLFTRGDIVQNVAATGSANALIGACTLSGRLAPAHPGDSQAVTQNQYVANSPSVYWCKTPGTTGTATKPTGTDATTTYTDGTAVWVYERPLATFAA